jgi:hypothetical protein
LVPPLLTCEELLAHYNLSDVVNASFVAGDGFCNKGPLNTAACGYDGGDCCYQTCLPRDLDVLGDPANSLEEPLEWGTACAPWSFECRDTRVSDDQACVVNDPPIGDISLNRPCPVGASARLGNGFCDADLNFAECEYDRGDCCRATCRYNATVLGSCSTPTFDCRDPRTAQPATPYVVPPYAVFDCAAFTDPATSAVNDSAIEAAIQEVEARTYTSFYTPCQRATFTASAPTRSGIGTACPSSHTVLRTWDLVAQSNGDSSVLQQRIYFYGDVRIIDPVCVIVADDYPSLGFSFGTVSSSPDFALPPGTLPQACPSPETPLTVFVTCVDAVGGAASSQCIYDSYSDELYFASQPDAGSVFVLRQGMLDGCGELVVLERNINVVDTSNTALDLSTCHDTRPVPGGQVLGERLPSSDVQSLTRLVCTQVAVTRTGKPDTWQVRPYCSTRMMRGGRWKAYQTDPWHCMVHI